MITRSPLWVLAALVCPGCGDSAARQAEPGAARAVLVAAAANLKPAAQNLERAFEQHCPQIDVRLTYGSSGQFFTQLSHQAPYDLFFSADAIYPQRLIDAGAADPGSRFVYAHGRLAVWVRRTVAVDPRQLKMGVVADPAVQRIAIANPRHSPYGQAAAAALAHDGFQDVVHDRLLLAENAAQAAHYALSGAAEVAIIPLSIAQTPPMQDAGEFWLVPAESHGALEQTAVVLTWATERAAADAFAVFVRGPQGQQILRRHGYATDGE